MFPVLLFSTLRRAPFVGFYFDLSTTTRPPAPPEIYVFTSLIYSSNKDTTVIVFISQSIIFAPVFRYPTKPPAYLSELIVLPVLGLKAASSVVFTFVITAPLFTSPASAPAYSPP